MAKTRPTDSGLPRRQPGKSLDAAGDDHQPICGQLTAEGDQSYVCVKNPGHLGEHTPTPVTTEAVKRLAARYGTLPAEPLGPEAAAEARRQFAAQPDTDPTVVLGNAEVVASDLSHRGPPYDTCPKCGMAHSTGEALRLNQYADEVLTAAASPRDGEMTDPPATPAMEVAESSPASRPTGSGGGAGRSHVRPDASEKMLAAAMAVVVPAADDSYQIRHAEEAARVLIVGAVVGNWVQAIADGRMVDDDDLRTVYRRVRQMAVAHDIDLDDGGMS